MKFDPAQFWSSARHQTFTAAARASACVGLGLAVVFAASCGKAHKSDDAADQPPPPVVGGPGKGALDPANAKVTAQTNTLQLSSSIVLLPPKKAAISKLALRDSSDAAARTVQLHVQSDAFDALDQVSNILCFFSQTKFWEQANKGKFKALVDTGKCEKKEQDQDQGPKLAEATVEATRKDGEPLKARVKFEMRREGKYETFHANVVVAAPPSDTDPAGVFLMTFAGYADEALTKSIGFGFIKTSRTDDGKTLLQFSSSDDNESDDGSRYKGATLASAILEKGSDGEFSGRLNSVSDTEETREGKKRNFKKAYKVRFDKDLMRVDGTAPSFEGENVTQKAVNQCFDRNKFRTFIWQYDVADSAGEQIALQSGFQIEATSGGRTFNGNAGYNGIWIPDDAKVANGQVVNRVEWKAGKKVSTPYTYVEAAGRLTKYEKKSVTLGQLKGTDFTMWDRNGGNGSFIVRWDGKNLSKVAKRSFGGGGGEQGGPTDSPVTPEVLDPSTFQDWGLGLHSDSLDAEVNIPKGTALSDTYSIGYHARTVVTKPADFPTESLLCFGQCPKITMSGSDLSMQMGGGSFTQGCPPPPSGTANKTRQIANAQGGGAQTCITDRSQNLQGDPLATYGWNASAMVIKDGDTSFSISVDAPSNKGQGGGGYMSGALIPASIHAALPAAVKSLWPDAATQEISTFYRWETGTDRWSKFTGLMGADSKLVTFDKPLEFIYQHTTTSDFDGDTSGPGIGKLYRLSYGGPGQLWGIPFRFLADVGRMGPIFSIRKGTKLDNFVVFPVEGEQRLAVAKAGACQALAIDKLPDLPKTQNIVIRHADLKGDLEVRYVGGKAP